MLDLQRGILLAVIVVLIGVGMLAGDQALHIKILKNDMEHYRKMWYKAVGITKG